MIDLARLLAARPWMDNALCAQVDTELFFPDKGGSTRSAKAICAACDVKAECLQYALDVGEEHGIWGGLSDRERRKIQPRRKGRPPAVSEPKLRALHRAGFNDREIARELGCVTDTVMRNRQRLGLPANHNITVGDVA